MKNSILFGTLIVLFALLAVPSAMADGTFYLVPQDSTGSIGGSTIVDLMLNVDETFAGYQIDINYDDSIVDVPAGGVTYVQWGAGSGTTTELTDTCTRLVAVGADTTAGTYLLATLTFEGQGIGVSDIHFTGNLLSNPLGQPITNIAQDGTFTISATPEPDLAVTNIDPYQSIFVDATNVFTVHLENQGTDDVTGSFDVDWEITDDSSFVLASGTETITGLNVGEEKTFDFEWEPTVLQDTHVTATVDSGSAVAESNEVNNVLSVEYVSGTGIRPLSEWGYGGDEPLSTYASGSVTGDLIYTLGDSAYMGGYNNPWSTYTVTFDVGTDIDQISGITEGVGSGTVQEARLYMYYNWYRTPLGWPADPEQKMTMSFDGSSISTDEKYEDSAGFGSYGDYKYGTFAYDVTSYVTGDGTYTAILTNDNSGDTHGTAIYGMALLIIYEDSTMDLREYHIAEGHDLLKQYYRSSSTGRYSYHVVPEDVTSTFDLPAVTGGQTNLFTVTAAAASSGDMSRLYFNANQWSAPWTYNSVVQMGFDTADVTALKADPNTVVFQDRGDGYSALNAIIISNTAKPDLVVTNIDPYQAIFVDATNVFTVHVENQGDADLTGSFDLSWEITDDTSTVLASGTETITDLAAGEEKTVDFEWMPAVLQDTHVSVTVDPVSAIDELNETNNDLLVEYVSGTGIRPLSEWGYGGDEPLTNYRSGTVTGDLIYTFGDSAYLGGYYNPWSTYAVAFNLGTDIDRISSRMKGVGSGTVQEARLYMYYNWYRTPLGWPADPEQKLTMTFNGNSISTDAKYEDSAGFGYYGDYKYGTFAYDVTSYVTGDGTYTAILTNDNSGDTHGTAIYSMALLIIYEDSTMDMREYHIAEGHDLLKQYYRSSSTGRYGYHVTPEDVTSTFDLPAVTDGVLDLFTVTAAAANGGDMSRLYFNTGQWSAPWNYISGVQMGTDTRDVNTLKGDPNTIVFQDRGDGYSATNAIFILNRDSKIIDLGSDQNTEVGRHIMVPITANDLDQFYGTIEMKLAYNPAIFNIVAVQGCTDHNDYPLEGILDMSAMHIDGIQGDVLLATVELEVIGGAGANSDLDLTVDLFEDIYGNRIYGYAHPVTISIASINALQTSATATPQSSLGIANSAILNDNSRLRHAGDDEVEISAVVTVSGLGLDTVIVDLSAIGGSANTLMSGPYPNAGTYTVIAKASDGIDGGHSFEVTATDTGGSSVSASTDSITVYRRGDVQRTNVVDMGDALYIARYTVGKQTVDQNHFDFVGDVQPASDGDHTTNMGDALYIARYTVGLESAP